MKVLDRLKLKESNHRYTLNTSKLVSQIFDSSDIQAILYSAKTNYAILFV